jgi:hypothetical protein
MATAPILAIPNLPSAPLQVQEIVLIGPSTRLGRMHGYSFIRHDEEGFIADAIDPLYSAPTHSQLDELRLPDPDSPLTMLALARAQVAFLHRMAPGVAAGGRLVLCEITKHEMRIWCAGDWSITTSTS